MRPHYLSGSVYTWWIRQLGPSLASGAARMRRLRGKSSSQSGAAEFNQWRAEEADSRSISGFISRYLTDSVSAKTAFKASVYYWSLLFKYQKLWDVLLWDGLLYIFQGWQKLIDPNENIKCTYTVKKLQKSVAVSDSRLGLWMHKDSKLYLLFLLV